MDPDAELDAILAQVEAASLVEQYTDDDGKQAMRLTPDGVRVARQLAMLGEDGQDELMAALLGEGDGERQCRRQAEAARWGYSAASSGRVPPQGGGGPS